MTEQRESQSRDVTEGESYRSWIYRRFGVDETPQNARSIYEDRMEEAGGDPRIVASRAEAEAGGFDMNAGQKYQVGR